MNSFGRLLRVSIYGESHGAGVGVVLDGCPPGLPLSAADFAADLARRQPGAPGTTLRREADSVQILSGLFEGRSSGAPLHFYFANADTRSADYDFVTSVPRPGHADWTAALKYSGYNDWRGSGHFSGRLTVGLVAAGVVAKRLLRPARIEASLASAGGQADIAAAVAAAAAAGDSVVGIVACSVRGLDAGLGEPFFDSVESLLAHGLFAIPGIRGLEFGDGFAAAAMAGSQHNDSLVSADGRSASNHHGGVNGGISNGNELCFRLAVKPTASITRPQTSFDLTSGQPTELRIAGRHDVCFAQRLPVVVEAVTALVLADLVLLRRAVGRPSDFWDEGGGSPETRP